MRIDDSKLQQPSNQPTRKAETNRVEAGYGKARDLSTEETTGATDTLVLSSLSSAIRVQSEDSPERSAKIDRLAKEFKSGRYNPDSREISKKIVEDAAVHGPASESPGLKAKNDPDTPLKDTPLEDTPRFLGPPEQNR